MVAFFFADTTTEGTGAAEFKILAQHHHHLIIIIFMSRGGRGRGRGGFGGGNNAASLPMGLSFSELQNLSREATALYPPRTTLPIFPEPTPSEKKIASLQLGFSKRLLKSKYHVTDRLRSNNRHFFERYSDKYLPSLTCRPTLKRKDLHAPFFPTEIFEDYFVSSSSSQTQATKKRRTISKQSAKIDLDALGMDERSNDGVPLFFLFFYMFYN